MKNLQSILESAGSNLDDVVKATLYVTDMSSSKAVNDVYRTYFSVEPLPVREMVCVRELPLKAAVEISVIAEKK